MADLSYLFGSSVPSSITRASTTTDSSLPDWLQDYTKGLMGNATAVAGETYNPYTGARIADQTTDQTNAAQGVRDAQGDWRPGLEFAGSNINSVAANGQTNIQNYMNPYTNNVVNRIGELGARNLWEKQVPQLNSTFAGAGQFGSTRNGAFMNNALRDNTSETLAAQGNALNTGYQNAVLNFQNDATRAGNVADMGQRLAYQDTAMLDTVGQAKQNLDQQSLNQGFQDFQAQQDYPKQHLDWLSQIMRGLPAQAQTNVMQNTAAPITTASPLQQAAAAFAGTRSALTGPTVAPATRPV